MTAPQGAADEASVPTLSPPLACRRDSTALTIVEIVSRETSVVGRERSLTTSSLRLPTYKVVSYMAWTGTKHDALVDLVRNVWNFSALVVDATRILAGLASFLADQPGRGLRKVIVAPFPFKSRKTTSDLGWTFSGLIDGGRLKEYADDGADVTRIYRHQPADCTNMERDSIGWRQRGRHAAHAVRHWRC